MPFAAQLQNSLRDRHQQFALEFAAGANLEAVLCRDLLTVESNSDTQLLTSVLLLDEESKHLWHGAAPSLPKSYCEAIDGSEIGPNVGSCGTAAYLGQAVYVTDIATDPLWKDYRQLALQHGLRACWSTPIGAADGTMLGTFAVYHLTPRGPTPDEIEAIRLITGHVSRAIESARGREDGRPAKLRSNSDQLRNGQLKLVSVNDAAAPIEATGPWSDEAFSARLQTYANKFEQYAGMTDSGELSEALKIVARDCRNLIASVSRDPNEP